MKKFRKSIGLFAAAFALCLTFAVGAKVNAADVQMQIGDADAGNKVQTMAFPEFGLDYLSSDYTSASVAVAYEYGDDWNRIGLFDVNGNLIATDDTKSYASFSGLAKNRVYYYRLQKISRLNGTPTSGWSEAKAFTTTDSDKIKMKAIKNKKAFTIKVPKIAGVKNYTILMSKKYDKGFKKVKTVKPGKKIKLTKFKKKAFKLNTRYYIRIQVKTKNNTLCDNFYRGSAYFYKTFRF